MLIGQNFNSYNVNSKPLGFRGGKADAAKKVAKEFVPQKIPMRGSRVIEGQQNGLLDDFGEKAADAAEKVTKKVGNWFKKGKK